MQPGHLDAIRNLLGERSHAHAFEALNSWNTRINRLLHNLRLPKEGWSTLEIESFLIELATLDSNNQSNNVGVGEREGRVFSSIVQRRNKFLAHGIGRSGNLMDVQPKSIGSSLVNILATRMVFSAMQDVCSLKAIRSCIILPVATGMSLTLCLLSLKQSRPEAQYVIWSRVDQKSCIKSIVAAGMIPRIVELVKVGTELITDIAGINDAIVSLKPQNVLCVMTTTSCFAPRMPDNCLAVAQNCSRVDIPHVINNAYGLQCFKCCHLVEEACVLGRVDYIVQSIDKNFLAPVGGAIVASPQIRLIEQLGKLYPGRASIAPSLDLLITLLEMGADTYSKLRYDRKTLYGWFKSRLLEVCSRNGLSLLASGNKISIAVSLEKAVEWLEDTSLYRYPSALTELGGMLQYRLISGARVITPDISQVIASVKKAASQNEGIEFPSTKVVKQQEVSDHQDMEDDDTPVGYAGIAEDCVLELSVEASNIARLEPSRKTTDVLSKNFGCHSNAYPYPYFTMACSIGVTKAELELFLERLADILPMWKARILMKPTSFKNEDIID